MIRTQNQKLLAFGIAANLVYLAYFKYLALIVDVYASIFVEPVTNSNVTLPIGISFFTFTQIAFLVDAYKGAATKSGPITFGLFVTLFPHLIAGPIYHHNEIIPQLSGPAFGRLNVAAFSLGIVWFSLGLAKKVLLADSLIQYVAAGFKPAASGGIGQIPFVDAWIAVFSYALQIYFDFSGYTDMAIGLAFMLGLRFPLNFNSPYKADSLIDFWRRWHMTLSRFLRNYLYIPLGGNKHGKPRRYLSLLITMLLGGLWHGASFNFLLWGGLHGFALAANHYWRDKVQLQIPSIIAKSMTLIFVVLAWVPFRSENIKSTVAFYESLFPTGGITFGENSPFQIITAIVWLTSLFGIALFAPNTQELLSYHATELNKQGWRATFKWAVSVGLLLGVATAFILGQRSTEFLYFRF